MDGGEIEFVPKSEWGVRNPGFIPVMYPPVSGIVFGFPQLIYAKNGKPTLGPFPDAKKCFEEVQFIQKKDRLKYPDIKYNFLIGPDGRIFEGRGWHQVASLPRSLKHINFYTYYICFIGDYTGAPPLKVCYDLREKFIRYGVQNNYIKKKHFVYLMHNNVSSEYEWFDFNKVTT